MLEDLKRRVIRLLTRGQKPAIGILLIVLLSACEREIASQLTNDGSLRAIVDLAEAGITASRSIEGKGKEASWSVMVQESSRSDALKILGRVRSFVTETHRGVGEESLLSDTDSKRENRERKIALLLEESLETLPRVRDVRVHLAPGDRGQTSLLELSGTRSTSESAAVLVTTYPNAEIDTEKISQLVSGATGVKQSEIMVVVNKLPEEIFRVISPMHEQNDSGDSSARLGFEAGKSFIVICSALFAVTLIIIMMTWKLGGLMKPIKLVIDDRC